MIPRDSDRAKKVGHCVKDNVKVTPTTFGLPESQIASLNKQSPLFLFSCSLYSGIICEWTCLLLCSALMVHTPTLYLWQMSWKGRERGKCVSRMEVGLPDGPRRLVFLKALTTGRWILEEAVCARQRLFTSWTHDWLHETCWVTVFNFPGWLRRSSQVHIIVFSVWFVLSLGLEFPSALCMRGAPGYLEFSSSLLTCQIKACSLWLD